MRDICRPSLTLDQGFTLLELLIAISLLTVVTGAAFLGFNSILVTKNSLEKSSNRRSTIQKTFLRIDRDLAQILPRSIRDEYGMKQPALFTSKRGIAKVEFTRNGWSNPTGLPRSNLQRVGYGFKDNQLIRWHWSVLDRNTGTPKPFQRTLLSGVRQFSVSFLDRNNRWRSNWPPTEEDYSPEEGFLLRLPKAIALTLDLDDFGEIKRIFAMVGKG